MTARIVLIEDDTDTAAFMKDMLGDLGHRIDTRAHLDDGDVDGDAQLVITDLVTLHAFDLAAAKEWVARVRAVFPNARIVVSTGHAPAKRAGADGLGADAVLTKPFDVAVFAAMVESLLGG
jgi:DNA-binding response OmpR family regulator